MEARVSFDVRRFPCIPKPTNRKAATTKSEILARGGSFYRFSINGCSSSIELEEYLLKQFGLSENSILSAIDVLSEATDQEDGTKNRDVWGVYELVNGKETITFTGFAFTEEELARKSELFLASIREMKGFLEKSLASAGRGMVGDEIWKV
ncbi:MAG: hypothetical protein EG822_13255 [Deltaproteobacteria bacterium]|nr:hypothetical protein [Deltaproteobacteria bacterium]TLN02332.1 MAG: hypothetical protein FDZ73_12430 [bacterium]